MDRFVKNFIAMSIVYLGAASVVGVFMLANPAYAALRFAHSHLMLLGWVSMMIYGVGYHILPRFAGKVLKSRRMGEAQFWAANIGLVGLTVFHTINLLRPDALMRWIAVASGVLELVSIALFFYNMMATVFGKGVD